jgi:hypothetical protein
VAVDYPRYSNRVSVEGAVNLQSNWRKAVIILVIIISGSCCCFLYFSFISFPSTEAIARSYLNAVVNQDAETALEWTQASSGCQGLAEESVLEDIAQYGGCDIRDVTIDVQSNLTGSDDEMQFAHVRFEYRRSDDIEWQRGEMRIFTDHDVPGLRYTCGNMLRAP